MVNIPAQLRDMLVQLGIDPAALEGTAGGPKVVVVSASLDDALEAVREGNREHVIMTRVDTATATQLDDWVKVGAAKSRSEAAALFMREGLNVRADDLRRLSDVLADYEAAKARLKRESDALFGRGEDATR